MTIYAVQRKLTGITIDQLAGAQKARDRLQRRDDDEGSDVRYIRSNFYPATRLHMSLRGGERGRCRPANDTAKLPYDRIEEVLHLNPRESGDGPPPPVTMRHTCPRAARHGNSRRSVVPRRRLVTLRGTPGRPPARTPSTRSVSTSLLETRLPSATFPFVAERTSSTTPGPVGRHELPVGRTSDLQGT